jgi:hypothetical protein
MLPKASKIPNTKSHVAQGKSISSVVVNNLAKPDKIRAYEFFSFPKKWYKL